MYAQQMPLREREIFEYFVRGFNRKFRENIIGAGKRNIKDTIVFLKTMKN